MKSRLVNVLVFAIVLTFLAVSNVFAADVVLDSVSDKEPGDTVVISGSTAMNEISIKVIAPNTTILYIDVVNGTTFNSTFDLPSDAEEGMYTVIAGQDVEVATTTFNVSKGSPGTVIPVEGVTLDKTATTIKVNKTTQLIATIAPSNATNKGLRWSSSDESIATVDQVGKVTGVKEGSATVTVTTVDGGFTAKCVVTVQEEKEPQPEVIAVSGVTLNKDAATVRVKRTTQLVATITPTNATNKGLTWSSSDKTVATVDQTGKVTGVKVGSATITVTTADGGFKAACVVTVKKQSSSDDSSSGGGGGGGSSTTKPEEPKEDPKEEEKEPEEEAPEETEEPTTPSSSEFTDVTNHWASKEIGKLVEKNIIGGYPDGTFKPNQAINRAEFITLVCRMLNLEPIRGGSTFKDVQSDAWYAGYVNAIQQAGIVGGYEDGTFRPSKKITREEAFVILYRMAKENLDASGNNQRFADDESISTWAKEAVNALVEAGVVGGYEDGTIKPKNNITRAETAKILAYFLQ